jgi:hypothetical protein
MQERALSLATETERRTAMALADDWLKTNKKKKVAHSVYFRHVTSLGGLAFRGNDHGYEDQDTGAFDGPDFVKGLADQTAQYTIVNSHTATLTFVGGFDRSPPILRPSAAPASGSPMMGASPAPSPASSASTRTWVRTGRSATSMPAEHRQHDRLGRPFVPRSLVSPTTYDFIGTSFEDVFLLVLSTTRHKASGRTTIFTA